MIMQNSEIAAQLSRLADLLEIEGANPFRVRAYRNASRTVANLPKPVIDLVAEKADLAELPGIGADLADKISTLANTGELILLKEIEQRTPALLSELLKIEGLGPKHVKVLYNQLGIHSLAELKRALGENKICQLKGFGKKTAQKIQTGLERFTARRRTKLYDAIQLARPLLAYLRTAPGVDKLEMAGSYRRKKETVGDLDILVTAPNGKLIVDHFIHYPEISKILMQGDTRCSVLLHSQLQVDLRVVPPISYGAALLYFTGSKAHTISLRRLALQKDLKINEYGVFHKEKRIAGASEAEIYELLGLTYIEPELRELRGEIKASRLKQLPRLVVQQDICGDLHSHTNATDGENSLEQMAKAAINKGYQYLAITDHSTSLKIARGLDTRRLLAQLEEIDTLNAQYGSQFTLLKAIEVDILIDGSLDLPNAILEKLDLRVCAIHSHFGLAHQKQTERIIRAMDNPYFNILAHPTGRLINKRQAYAIDLERILQAAKERGCFLELNAQPDRLDLTDIHCRLAKDIGVKLAISTDAHNANQLDYMQLGVYQARRGWLEAENVLNTYNLTELRKLLKRD